VRAAGAPNAGTRGRRPKPGTVFVSAAFVRLGIRWQECQAGLPGRRGAASRCGLLLEPRRRGRSFRDLNGQPHLARKARSWRADPGTKQAPRTGRFTSWQERRYRAGPARHGAALPPNTLERESSSSPGGSPRLRLAAYPAGGPAGRWYRSYSKHDRLILGWGTRTFGTVDRTTVSVRARSGSRSRRTPTPRIGSCISAVVQDCLAAEHAAAGLRGRAPLQQLATFHARGAGTVAAVKEC